MKSHRQRDRRVMRKGSGRTFLPREAADGKNVSFRQSRSATATELFFWVVAAGLLFLQPLLFDRNFTEQFSYPKLVLTEALLLIASVPVAAALAGTRRLAPLRRCYTGPLLLFCGAALLASLNSAVPAFSLHQALYLLCGPAWLGILCVLAVGSERTVRSLASLGAISGSIVAAIALFQWMGYDPILARNGRVDLEHMVSRMHLYATLGNPNFVAGYLIGIVFLTAALCLVAEKAYLRVAWFVATLVVLLAIVGTGSFGAWIGLAGGVAAAMLIWSVAKPTVSLLPRKKPERGPRGLYHSAAEAALGCVLLATGVPTSVRGWVVGILQSGATRLAGRVYLSRASWPLFKLHPWLGNGAGAVQLRFLDLQAHFLALHPAQSRFWSNITQLHNDPLQLLLECGVLGFSASLWILVAYARSLRATLSSSPSSSSCVWLATSAGGVAAILVDSIFNFQFSIAPTWILLFTLMAFPILIGSQTGQASLPNISPGQQPLPSPPARRILRRLATTLAITFALAGIFLVARQAIAEWRYAEGMRYENSRYYVLAEATYRQGLQLDPHNGRLHFGLARALYLQRELPEALREAKLAKATYADSHLEVLKARIQESMGKADSALASYQYALWLDPHLRTVPAEIARLKKR
jgi:putative inorganic carbon (hco3(-)) transporter